MLLSALSSGSSGNCFYIEGKRSAVLIDAGISCKKIVDSLGKIDKTPEKVKAVFITHEHSDHVKGADVFARKFQIPIFATKKTFSSCFLCSDETLINTIHNKELIKINDLEIQAFPKPHKAADPVSYSVSSGKKVSIITDLGYPCKNSIEHISDSDFLFLESNHDLEMLEQGPYPYYLKSWIKSNSGHLSNLQTALCILEHGTPKLKNIVLSHLSKTNNTPQIALSTFSNLIKERFDLHPRISVSEREAPTQLFRI